MDRDLGDLFWTLVFDFTEPRHAVDADGFRADDLWFVAARIVREALLPVPRAVIAAGGRPDDAAHDMWNLATVAMLENGWTVEELVRMVTEEKATLDSYRRP